MNRTRPLARNRAAVRPPATAGGARAARRFRVPLAVSLAPLLLFGVLGPAAAQRPADKAAQNRKVLQYHQKVQARNIRTLRAFHDFRFTDRVEDSGITFRHRIVDDAGRDYKAVHYDHGNGLAIADVDGDGLLDVYFTTQLGSNELWKNLGGGKFRDVTAEAGVGLADRVGVSAAFGDIDNDGDPDLYATTVKMGNVLFENDGSGKFTDISRKAGVDYTGHSSAPLFFDYNRDGLLDLFVSNIGTYTTDERGRGGYWIGFPEDAFRGHLHEDRFESSILYENRGGNRFQDVTEKVGLVDYPWSGDASPTDFNEDGWPDLYVLNMQGDDEYYVNVEGKRFEKKSRELFPKTPWGSMGVKSFDFNNDGNMDLYLTDMHSDMSKNVGPTLEARKSQMLWGEDFLQTQGRSIFGNALFENTGTGRFIEISDQQHVEQYWPWGLSVGDLNADGYEDIFVAASMNYPFRYGINSLFLNDGGRRFYDVGFALGIEPRRDGRTMTPWFELDCSAHAPEEAPETDQRLWGADRDECEGQTGVITVMGSLGTRSSVIFDLDGDGDLDIVTNDFNSEPMVLVSDLADKRDVHFLKVKLTGTKSNRDGLGAKVVVHAGGKRYTKVHDGVSGYLSHSLPLLYFGLGDAARADKVEVTWPSGTKQTITEGIPANGILTVEETGKAG